jgi:lysozyme family protein
VDIANLIEGVIGREGAYADHPADRGGPTKWGVTEAVARAQGYRGAMRELPRDRAVAIYRRLYWEKPGFERIVAIAPRIAAELFDTGVNMGPATALSFLVRALNVLNRSATDYPEVTATGVVTEQLLTALEAFVTRRGQVGELVLLSAMNGLQAERYIQLAERRPANEAFLYGWLANRVHMERGL